MRVRAQLHGGEAVRGFAPYPHPSPSPGGRGAIAVPSPTGRRCPVGADEGAGATSWDRNSAGLRPVPSPQPLSRWERGYRGSFSHRDHGPLFGGRCPVGADEGAGAASWGRSSARLRPVPSPQPLSWWERGYRGPFSHRDHGPLFGGRCPAGADEGAGAASWGRSSARLTPRTLTPTPLPVGEGLTIGRRGAAAFANPQSPIPNPCLPGMCHKLGARMLDLPSPRR